MKLLKLNLGAGHDHRDGWLNTDIDVSTHPDKIVDLSKPLPFKSNQADEVMLQDVLEHFLKEDGQRLMAEIARVLKPQGKLYLRIPNVLQIQSQFANDPEVMMEFVYGTTDKNGIWGVHKYGYTKEMLQKLLKINGFENVVIDEETTNLTATCTKSGKVAPTPHILIIQQAPDWGGAEEWMATLVGGWKKAGYLITGYTNLPRLTTAWNRSGATTGKIPFILDIIGNYKGLIKSVFLVPYALYWYASVLRNQKKQGVNCIVMSGFSEKLLVTFLAKLVGLPIVWFEYGPLKEVFKKNFYLPKVLYRGLKDIPEVVVTISDSTKQSLITDARISLAKIKVVAPGVELTDAIAPLPKNLVIGHLSRLTPEKGQRLLIESFALLSKKYPNARLKIAGKGPDSRYLVEFAKKLGIEKKVEFVGFIKDKKAFYDSISLFLFTSVWPLEGFGMVMAEAMAHGRPVVAIENGPAREVVGNSGGMICAANAKSIVQGIDELIKKGLPNQSKKAYAYANDNYQDTMQIEKIRKQIVDVVKLHQ